MKKPIGHDVREIGERQRQRRLGERIVAGPADQGQHEAARQEAEHAAPPKNDTKNSIAPSPRWGSRPLTMMPSSTV